MKTKKLTAVLLALFMTLSLCACGGRAAQSASGESGAYYSTASSAAAPVPAPMEAPAAMADMAYEEAAYEQASGLSSSNSYSPKAESAEPAAAEGEQTEKIIYSGDATVETTEFEKSIADLEAMIAQNGGFIESSSVNGSNYYDSARGYTSRRSASYTLRVPSDRFSAIMGSLSTIGNVPYTYTYTENVTAQYYDTQARLKAYEAQEERLIEMMELAETVEDIITIEDKLTDVRYRIDSLQSNLKNWDRRVAYSTLNITVREVQVYTPETVTKITYGERLRRAFTAAMENTGEFFKDLLVFLVSILPALVILAVLFFVLRPLLKKLIARGRARREERRGRRAARKAAKAAAQEAEKQEKD